MIRVLFVCLGNICRSPMAEAVFRHEVLKAGLESFFHIDSAGTGNWHIGKRPHEGTLAVLDKHEVNYMGIKARQVNENDLTSYDYIIAMDASNMGYLHRIKTVSDSKEIYRLLDFVPENKIVDVPDPYFTGNFEEVYKLVHHGCIQLLDYIRKTEPVL